jgi:hypothetical protein
MKETILILLNNHESYCTLDAILYCIENGIAIYTYPSHCTHQLQLLEVAVTGPFKMKLAQK